MERIQLSRKRGWRMPTGAVKVDRTTRWGNPFHTHGDGYPMTREVARWCFEQMLRKYGAYIGRGNRIVTVEDIRRELAGKNLACWCPFDEPCHADVLLKLAN